MLDVYKPIPEAYQRAAALLQLQPHEILMVACHNFDLDAARGVGYRTCFVRRPDEWGTGRPARCGAQPGLRPRRRRLQGTGGPLRRVSRAGAGAVARPAQPPQAASDPSFASFCRLRIGRGMGWSGNSDGQAVTATSPT